MPMFASRNVNMAPRLDAMSFVVRTSVTPGALTEPVRRAVSELDSNLALGQLRTLQETLDRAAAQMAFTNTNPHVGLIFLVPGRDETLRVNGRAWITRDGEVLRGSVVHGKTPVLAIGVEVDQCFFHCPKALLRSRLWAHDRWPARDALPSFACVLFDQVQPKGATLQDYERDIAESNASRLY
jgi:predicted pyridoxine 5'-phosphate oxidase superfamily flavin-nucleotide-binding protein